jgi:hypothetical protein
MSQFYVADKESADRAKRSILDQRPETISGTVHDKVGFFIGVVQSVEEIAGKGWRITILDGK